MTLARPSPMPRSWSRRTWLGGGLALAALAGCSQRGGLDTGGYTGPVYDGPPRREFAYALTETGDLFRFSAGKPGYPDQRLQLTGAATGDLLVALAWQPARRQMVVLGRSGRLYAVNARTGTLAALNRPTAAPLPGRRFVLDIDAGDGLARVIGDGGTWRGAVDGVLQAEPLPARLDALASSRAADGRSVLRHGVDATGAQLLRVQAADGGGLQVAVIGALGLPPLARASLDVADGAEQGLLLAQFASEPLVNRLALVDLDSGRARLLGLLPSPPQVLGLALER